MHFVPSQLGKSFSWSQLGSLIHLWQAPWLTEASWSKGMLTRMTCLYSICSFSPQQVSPGLYTWWSQGPKSEAHIKASWGQAQNLQFPFHCFFKSNQVAWAAQIEGVYRKRFYLLKEGKVMWPFLPSSLPPLRNSHSWRYNHEIKGYS